MLPTIHMRFFLRLVLTAGLLNTGIGYAGIVSTATLLRGGGKVIFDLYDEPALLPECSGRNDLGATARSEVNGKAVPYGAGCWIAGADGFVTMKIKSFDDGIVRTSRVHSSEFKSASVAPKTGATELTATGGGPWTFGKGTTNRGTAVCALTGVNNSGKRETVVSIKSLANREYLNLTMHDARWNFKPESRHVISLDFEDQKPLRVPAFGDGKVLDADLPQEATAVFLILLAEKKNLRLQVPGSDIVSVGLSGIHGELKQFLDCVRARKSR